MATATAATGTAVRLGPVRPGPDADGALRPAAEAAITAGFWHARRTVNAEVCVPQGPDLLESAGNLHNLRLAAGGESGEYRGTLPFLDSDVYKWLEAASWLSAERQQDTTVADAADEMIDLI